jgi:hypothetical protein
MLHSGADGPSLSCNPAMLDMSSQRTRT